MYENLSELDNRVKDSFKNSFVNEINYRNNLEETQVIANFYN